MYDWRLSASGYLHHPHARHGGYSAAHVPAHGLRLAVFVAQGILINNWPLAITNIITGASAAVITVIKLRNDARKRRNRAMASDVEKVAHQHPRNNQSQH